VPEVLYLDPIPDGLRPDAVCAFYEGDVRFLYKADNTRGLELVYGNMSALKVRGFYERALLEAFIGTRTNNSRWPLADLHYLFEQCDRTRLLAAGDPLPDGERFTIYRGVAGRGPARRIGGLSWTDDLERARWFANRFAGLHDPAVYVLEVARADVLAYTHQGGRKEQEFIVIPERAAIRRLDPALKR
jgi:hypothetical protein